MTDESGQFGVVRVPIAVGNAGGYQTTQAIPGLSHGASEISCRYPSGRERGVEPRDLTRANGQDRCGRRPWTVHPEGPAQSSTRARGRCGYAQCRMLIWALLAKGLLACEGRLVYRAGRRSERGASAPHSGGVRDIGTAGEALKLAKSAGSQSLDFANPGPAGGESPRKFKNLE